MKYFVEPCEVIKGNKFRVFTRIIGNVEYTARAYYYTGTYVSSLTVTNLENKEVLRSHLLDIEDFIKAARSIKKF